MKKIILMAVAATLVLTLAACSNGANNSSKPNPQPESSQGEQEQTAKIQTYIGEVKDKVGNDITLSVGNLILENENGDGQGMMIDENGNQVPIEGGIGDNAGGQTIMIPAPDDGGADGNSTDGSEIEKLPIEFTGEVRDFTIPAGAKVINAMGKETTLDSIKKGSLVQLIINETSGVVESVMVW
ncbi:hypothetical protein [Vallitalea maricola]|uniref:Uncharacterized protein n=1 Tax=Vallitalea maricola TaxID=3074433 RepID=A0ACB5UG06_9FIRM|nr:hypothetical protein AN2V17_07130 [Vallitalea sp. AN17-2]